VEDCSWIKRILLFLSSIALLFLALLIPAPVSDVPVVDKQTPFVWDQDKYWRELEENFRNARMIGCNGLEDSVENHLSRLDSLILVIDRSPVSPSSKLFSLAEKLSFETGVLLGVCPKRIPDYIRVLGKLRKSVKEQSTRWDLNSPQATHCLYRLIYGGRSAAEEAMLQALPGSIPELQIDCSEPSQTPSIVIHGVKIHSGDILVSRGGAPTSALIARGSDYPGNFSHTALVHIDSETEDISILEAHIECGVTVSSVDDYLNDTKLRIMILRMRADSPELKADPLAPHRAACYALNHATSGHTAYDFAMDYEDHERHFCSEVVSAAYEQVGIELWRKKSFISEPGLRSWLSAFGVRHFKTQEPSDLEYDPQLRVVAEWRDSKTLMKDHIDNAIIDVMLEGARNGDRLEYSWYMLPIARIIKLYCVVLNWFGEIGPIPEGMGATAALQNQWLGEQHRRTKTVLQQNVSEFRRANGYSPPYWELVRLAREAYAGHDSDSKLSNPQP